MAQSATKERALLGIEPFWERPTLKPPLRWERWRILLKLAIPAKESISNDILREAPPDEVTLPLEAIYKVNVDNSMAQSERDHRIRNEQIKSAWLNKCQKSEAAGIFRGDRQWKVCDTKAVSLTKVNLGMEGWVQ